MDYDALLLLGLALGPLALVSFVAAWADRRRPWTAAGLAAASTALVVTAALMREGGLPGIAALPEFALETVARLWR